MKLGTHGRISANSMSKHKKSNSSVTKGAKKTSDGPVSQLFTQVSYGKQEFHCKSQKVIEKEDTMDQTVYLVIQV